MDLFRLEASQKINLMLREANCSKFPKRNPSLRLKKEKYCYLCKFNLDFDQHMQIKRHEICREATINERAIELFEQRGERHV